MKQALRFVSSALLVITVLSAVACATRPATATEPGATDVSECNCTRDYLPAVDPAVFRFVIIADRTYAHREGVFASALDKVNLLQPDFVMSIGDLIEGNTLNRAKFTAQYDEIDSMVAKLEAPFFYLPGNHDIYDEVMEEFYLDRFGRTWYHFVYRDVLFLCLNSEDGLSSFIGDEQAEYVARVLDDNRSVRWTFVFIHQPLWVVNPNQWTRIEPLLAGRRHTVFAGHLHKYMKEERSSSDYFTLATTGGMSNLRGAEWGEFDHVLLVTMTADGPRYANLMLDGIADEDIRTK